MRINFFYIFDTTKNNLLFMQNLYLLPQIFLGIITLISLTILLTKKQLKK